MAVRVQVPPAVLKAIKELKRQRKLACMLSLLFFYCAFASGALGLPSEVPPLAIASNTSSIHFPRKLACMLSLLFFYCAFASGAAGLPSEVPPLVPPLVPPPFFLCPPFFAKAAIFLPPQSPLTFHSPPQACLYVVSLVLLLCFCKFYGGTPIGSPAPLPTLCPAPPLFFRNLPSPYPSYPTNKYTRNVRAHACTYIYII